MGTLHQPQSPRLTWPLSWLMLIKIDFRLWAQTDPSLTQQQALQGKVGLLESPAGEALSEGDDHSLLLPFSPWPIGDSPSQRITPDKLLSCWEPWARSHHLRLWVCDHVQVTAGSGTICFLICEMRRTTPAPADTQDCGEAQIH